MMVDMFCGLGGATAGFLAEGWECFGVDIEQHVYGEHRYPGHLWLQDIRTVNGAQFKNADFIWASPPCQEYSWMAMPWSRAKQVAAALRGYAEFPEGYKGSRTTADLTALFDACFRIQREASAAAGRHIPMVVENVRGAQPWVGRARWSYGSFYLWGDVPALMPAAKAIKVPTMGEEWYPPGHPKHVPGLGFNTHAARLNAHADPRRGRKNTGGSWFNVAHNTTSGKGQNPDGRKIGGDWFSDPTSPSRTSSSKSKARKFASAMIAKIPEPLSRWIAATYHPAEARAA